MFHVAGSAALVVVLLCTIAGAGRASAEAPGEGSGATDSAEAMTHPRFPRHGGVFPVDGSSEIAAVEQWKLVLDVTEKGDDSKPHSGLTHAAPALNLFAHAGVPDENVDVALVVHGDATPLVLSDAAYRRARGRDNPNSELLARLREEGVAVKICGQSLLHHGFSPRDLSDDVTLELSAMTALAKLQKDGYALVP